MAPTPSLPGRHGLKMASLISCTTQITGPENVE
jgi:hypothetical protein